MMHIQKLILFLIFLISTFAIAQTGERYEKFVGYQKGKYPLTLAGVRQAINDLPNDSGVVNISYPGIDTTGLGAVPVAVYLKGFIGGRDISGASSWGSIFGTLNNQTDLKEALGSKIDTTLILPDTLNSTISLKLPKPVSNLVSNGLFNTNISGWGSIYCTTLEWVASGGGFTGAAHVITNTYTLSRMYHQNMIPVIKGVDYKVTVDIYVVSLPANNTLMLDIYDDNDFSVANAYITTTGLHHINKTFTTKTSTYSDMLNFSIVKAGVAPTGIIEFYVDNVVITKLYYADVVLKNSRLSITADSTIIGGYASVGGTLKITGQLYAEGQRLNPTTINNIISGLNYWMGGLSSPSYLLSIGRPGRQFLFNNGAYTDFWIGGGVTIPYNLPAGMAAYEYRTDYKYNVLKQLVSHSNITYIDGTGTPTVWDSIGRARFVLSDVAVGVGDLPDSVGLDWNWDDFVGSQVQLFDEVNMTAGAKRFPMPIVGYRFRLGGVINNYTLPKVYAFYSDFTAFGKQGRVEQGWHFYGRGNFPSYFGGSVDANAGYNYSVDTSSTDAYRVVLKGDFTLIVGLEVTFKVTVANTDGATLQINSLVATALTKATSSGVNTVLATGDIIAGQIVKAVYDGTQFQVISRLAQ